MAWGVRPHPRINSVEALWFSSGVSFGSSRHTANAERARDAQPEPVACGGSSDGTVGCTAQADPNSGQTKCESLLAD